jgi:MFS family permease
MLRFLPVFLATFFLSLNYGALLYVNSSYLAKFWGANAVSVLFLLSAFLSILLFLSLPKLLNRFGKKKMLIFFLIILLSGALGMALSGTALWVGAFFISSSAMFFMTYYCLDIFLEEESVDKHTGGIRGIYLTTLSAGIALGPLLLSYFVIGEELRQMYFLAAILITLSLLLSFFLPNAVLKHSVLKKREKLPFRKWWHSRSLRAITLARVSLEIFYALMVIYTPIYLHNHIGFEWAELGIIFTVALLPFIILMWPAGELADRFWGEKEMLTLGFFVTGVALLAMPFIGKSFFIWMIILFLSRIGAALIEIMTDSYFFKKINAADTGMLSIFRIGRPLGLILGTIIGIISLNIFSIEKLFFIVSVVIFIGMREALYIKDTL